MKKILQAALMTSVIIVLSYNAKAQTITTVVGNGISGFMGDSAAANACELHSQYGTHFDTAGNLYIADALNHRIRKVSTNGIITTVVGTGVPGYSGDGAAATAAQLYRPTDVAIDAMGNLYIADEFNFVVRKVDTAGIISTYAGTNISGYSGDGGMANVAQLSRPNTITIDVSGNMYISLYQDGVIRKIDTAGIISTIAGSGAQGYSGDGGQATSASFYEPCKVAIDNSGNLYIADEYNQVVRKVDASGIITTVAGNGSAGYSGDGGPATSASINYCEFVQVDGSGNLYIADKLNNRIRKVDASSGIITTIVGNGNQGYSGDGSLATSASIYYPEAITFDVNGNLYFSDWGNSCVRKVDFSSTPCTSSNIITVSGDSTMCAGDTIILTASGSANYSWGANTIITSASSAAVYPTISTVYSVTGVDTNGCVTNPTSFTVNVANGCVWPGDANEDLVVDMYDMLTLGMQYGDTGAARSSVSTSWWGYSCTNWQDTLAYGNGNAKYADCNGDGKIDLNDTVAITANYSQTHAYKQAQPQQVFTNNADVYVVFNQSNYAAGDVVNADVYLGSSSNQQSNFYGTTFSINYDPTTVVSGSEKLAFANSWIGTMNVDNMNISHISSAQGKVDAAIVRINHTNTSGYGKIATFSFTLKNSVSNGSLAITTTNGVKIDHVGNQLTLNTGTDTASISSAAAIQKITAGVVSVYPNPTKGLVTFNLSSSTSTPFTITNNIGQVVKAGNFTKSTTLDVSDLDNGVYFVNITQNNQNINTKIIIQK
jgi:hypothetical protein